MDDPDDTCVVADRLAEIRQRPMLAPWIVADPIPTLTFIDAGGRQIALALDGCGLARLALSIAEAQAIHARRAIESASLRS